MSLCLTSDFWVAAYRARLDAQGIFVHIARRGDATAGAVWVKCATMNGRATVLARTYDADFNRVWTVHLDDVPEPEADAALARQAGFDGDLWIVEVEDPRGRHLLDEEGLD
ncbi:MAG: DUF1491 family protein [Pseudomonadota bacterium]